LLTNSVPRAQLKSQTGGKNDDAGRIASPV